MRSVRNPVAENRRLKKELDRLQAVSLGAKKVEATRPRNREDDKGRTSSAVPPKDEDKKVVTRARIK